jgi:hypothetical protein
MTTLPKYPRHAAISFNNKDETATKKHPVSSHFIPISRLIARFTAYTHILYDEAEITRPPKIAKKKFLKKRNGNTFTMARSLSPLAVRIEFQQDASRRGTDFIQSPLVVMNPRWLIPVHLRNLAVRMSDRNHG